MDGVSVSAQDRCANVYDWNFIMLPLDIKIDHDYYIVELNNYKLPFEAYTWLKENCKSPWIYRHPNIYFENKSDHLMFTLRWS